MGALHLWNVEMRKQEGDRYKAAHLAGGDTHERRSRVYASGGVAHDGGASGGAEWKVATYGPDCLLAIWQTLSTLSSCPRATGPKLVQVDHLGNLAAMEPQERREAEWDNWKLALGKRKLLTPVPTIIRFGPRARPACQTGDLPTRCVFCRHRHALCSCPHLHRAVASAAPCDDDCTPPYINRCFSAATYPSAPARTRCHPKRRQPARCRAECTSYTHTSPRERAPSTAITASATSA